MSDYCESCGCRQSDPQRPNLHHYVGCSDAPGGAVLSLKRRGQDERDAKDDEIERLRGELESKKDGGYGSKWNEEELRAEIERLRGELADREKRIHKQCKRIGEEHEIEALREDLQKEKDNTTFLAGQLGEQEDEIERLREERTALGDHFNNLAESAAEKDKLIGRLKKELQIIVESSYEEFAQNRAAKALAEIEEVE